MCTHILSLQTAFLGKGIPLLVCPVTFALSFACPGRDQIDVCGIVMIVVVSSYLTETIRFPLKRVGIRMLNEASSEMITF